MGKDGLEGTDAGLMQAVLARLAKVSPSERADFVARCWAVWDELDVSP